MAQHRYHGHQHGQNSHGQCDRPQRLLVLGVFGLLLQLLRFVGFHGVTLLNS
jgi:hypothetical protein